MAGGGIRERVRGILPSTSPTSKNRVQHTQYPWLPFHGLRFAQLVSSIIVSAIMYYFIWNLHHDHIKTPWTFIVLTAVSSATILALAFTIVLHCFVGLKPALNIFVNTALLIVWAMGFSLLSWWSSGTISNSCNVVNWHEDTGIRVCRLYKALFTFAMTAMLFTFAALFLDIYVLRLQNRRGRYVRTRDNFDSKAVDPSMGPGAGARRLSAEVWNAESLEVERDHELDQTHPSARESDPLAPPKSYSDRSKKAESKEGYEAPQEQFGYDTGYHGPGSAAESRGQGFEGLRSG